MSIIVNLPQNIGKDKNGNSYSTISGDQTITGNVTYTNTVQGTITNSEKDSDDNVITDTYSTKTENSQTLVDAKAYTDEKVSGLVNSAPETLDTLNELAQALGNDANFATTVSTEIGKKANSSDVYTKTETNSLLNGKSDTTHNHDSAYLGINSNAVSATKATNNSSGNELTNTIVKGISISGKTITVTKLDGSTYTLTTQDTNTTYSNFVKSGSTAAAGLVPAPPTTAGTTKYLREDGTWQVPPDDNTTYSKLSQFTNDSGYITGITKTMVTNALGYTPPTTNTTYSAGSNITLSGTTFSLTKANVTGALGYTPPTTNTTYSNATTSASGLMSASDKSKLDGIASGANKYSLPASPSVTSLTVTNSSSAGVVFGSYRVYVG